MADDRRKDAMDREGEARPAKDADARDADAVASGNAEDGADGAAARSWSNLWQVPTILLSLGLIVAAIVLAMRSTPENDFDAALAHVELLMENAQLDEAADVLRDLIEPHLDLATSRERARFHAAVGDWVSLSQDAARVDLHENNTRIDESYREAARLGLTLDAPRHERWANALISLDRPDEARRKLDVLDVADGSAEARARYARVFRRLIDHALRRDPGGLGTGEIMRLLAEYRGDDRTSLDDRLWAAARQAEVRFETGEPQRAVDHLLVDLRRLEIEAADGRSPRGRAGFGELYVLLGRGYFEIGDDIRAEQHMEEALSRLEGTEAVMGEALVLLGRIAAARGDLEDAFERFELAAREFPATGSELPALLGRAEVASMLGRHEESQRDYAALVNRLARSGRAGPARLSPQRIARSLIDRHDACLALGRLDTAIEYARLAERFFEPGHVPVDVLHRIATTSRQFADNMLAAGEAIVDRATRAEANVLYRQAGEYFVRHARALTGLPNEEANWAKSLYDAADNFDLGGLYDRAIRHFEEYIAGRSVHDPMRSDVNFRLAQCHHALMQYEAAADHYERVIQEHPRSAQATRSHVPLARCYLALGRRSEAEKQLRQIVAGLQPIRPDAMDFRDALFELGVLYYDAGQYAAAIQQFDEAVKRYPDDPRVNDLRFRLADSYRSLAQSIAERLRVSTTESPGERRQMDADRREHLRAALDLYQIVVARYEAAAAADRTALNAVQQDLLRTAYLHRGDCAFGLGLYEEAVHLYDQAARIYSDHHTSIHALIQIVNCFVELGDEERARAAHRRALVRLRQLRDDAFDAPDALLERAAWERWLEHSPAAPPEGPEAQKAGDATVRAGGTER